MLGWELAWGTRTQLTALPLFLPDIGNTIITTASITQELMASQTTRQAPACGQE